MNELKDLDKDFILKEIKYLDDSKEYNHKVGEKISEIVNRIDSDGKPQVFGRLFRNLIHKNLSYRDFLKLTNIVEKTFYYDLILLKECRTNGNFYIDIR
ncbi:hypothetical protein [Chryseobacterium sp. MP_3.2]|uniref:hypothetical protein n=1 Tax=Chryseobacterium sp. MP_3.2 TaxID=3071712 RepID=UPI002DFF0083|nr:hypothetical protein [Chryseobacterium sp. MP_3.2]